MLQFGLHITQSGDPLQKIEPERLFLAIQQPKQQFRDMIEQLRMVQTLDENRYRELKKQLPYFVCGIFHPAIRRGENFAAIEYFMLDIDRLSPAGFDKTQLREQLRQLPEVVMLFQSPSGDGLKIMFRLSEKCTDAALFSAFYKLFARRFAEKNGLTSVIDYKTSDVTRACFLSFDPDAFYHASAELIDLQAFLPDLNFDKAEKDIMAAEVFLKTQTVSPTLPASPDEETLKRIKEKLNPHYRQPKEKQLFVPQEIDRIIPVLNERLAEFEMRLAESQPINYGKKLKIVCHSLWAEINIFYGKQGFKVVQTTKTGSNPELAKIAAQVLEQILAIV